MHLQVGLLVCICVLSILGTQVGIKQPSFPRILKAYVLDLPL